MRPLLRPESDLLDAGISDSIMDFLNGCSNVWLLQQGLLLIQAFDQYITVLLTLVLAFLEIMLMGWFYGQLHLKRMMLK